MVKHLMTTTDAGGLVQPLDWAELYRADELPQTLANLLNDLVWCDQAAAYIQDHDPARVYLTPSPPPRPLEG